MRDREGERVKRERTSERKRGKRGREKELCEGKCD